MKSACFIGLFAEYIQISFGNSLSSEHRFEVFTGDFAVWVMFYGAEGGEANI